MADKEYIEREVAECVLKRLRDKCGNDEMEFALNWALELLDIIPAADVRPVVRGRWERPKTINGRVKCMICSACGIGQVFRTEYCPNCGADMRESDAP